MMAKPASRATAPRRACPLSASPRSPISQNMMPCRRVPEAVEIRNMMAAVQKAFTMTPESRSVPDGVSPLRPATPKTRTMAAKEPRAASAGMPKGRMSSPAMMPRTAPTAAPPETPRM